VQYIDASPIRKGSAYFAVYRYLLGDYQPYAYRTDDYGKTWTRLTTGKNGVPADWPTRVVREDPNREGLLYLGTEFGMFISFDNGAHWQPFQLNLPTTPITDIKIHHKDLVVSTQGRAFWILDNISALEQLTPTVTPTSPHLFKPRDGYRTRVSPNLLGPTVDYFLPAEPSGRVTLDILDAKGTAVNSYNSDAPPAGGRGGRGGRGGGGAGAGAGGGAPAGDQPEAGAGGGGFGRGGGGVVTRVTKNAGMNRVVWDGRGQNGLAMPPGAYQARLTMDGATQTQPLTVLIDPRIAAEGVTNADLVEQYEHNVKMRELQAAVTQLVSRARDARGRLQNATGADADKAKQVQTIYDKLVNTPEGIRYNKPGLQEHVQYLAGMTANTDQKIARDAISRYAELKKEFDGLKAELDKVIGPGH